MSFHIVLVEPEIPPNTGNIARTCAATGTKLHLVEPLGFDINEKQVRRAGLDYWPYVDLKIHSSLDVFFKEYLGKTKYYVTTSGTRSYSDITYEDETMFLFGKETKGLPKELLRENQQNTIRIPMKDEDYLRSLNLSNSANIILYEALRQKGFPGLV